MSEGYSVNWIPVQITSWSWHWQSFGHFDPNTSTIPKEKSNHPGPGPEARDIVRRGDYPPSTFQRALSLWSEGRAGPGGAGEGRWKELQHSSFVQSNFPLQENRTEAETPGPVPHHPAWWLCWSLTPRRLLGACLLACVCKWRGARGEPHDSEAASWHLCDVSSFRRLPRGGRGSPDSSGLGGGVLCNLVSWLSLGEWGPEPWSRGDLRGFTVYVHQLPREVQWIRLNWTP